MTNISLRDDFDFISRTWLFLMAVNIDHVTYLEIEKAWSSRHKYFIIFISSK